MGLSTDALSYTDGTFALPKTVKKTLGHPLETTTDFAFAADANLNAQNIDLGEIIPAHARVLDVSIRCYEAVTSSGGAFDTVDMIAGNASTGNQFAASVDLKTQFSVSGSTAAGACMEAISNTAQHVWVQGAPTTSAGATWAVMDGGMWEVWITYLDYDSIKET